MDEKVFDIKVENDPTILSRIIQVIKRRRINIKSLIATEVESDKSIAEVKLILETDGEKARLVKSQLKKLVDVIEIK